MKIRVLHVDTERGWRGGERQALWLAQALARRGHYSIVAARGDEPLFARAAAAGLATATCNPRGEVDIRAALGVHAIIKRERIDVVHAHTAHAVALSALATLGTNVPFIASRRVDFRLRKNAGTRWKYGRAAALVAISRAVADVLEESGIPRSRIVVVPDGVDLTRHVVPATKETLADIGVRDGAPLVVQVAQLVGHKDPVNFVRAIAHARARVPELQALLIGDGPLRPDVDREIANLELEDVLFPTGYRTDADELLAAADVVCLSSREEGMGSVLLDALAFGKPIAATRAGGIPEVIADGESGLLAPVNDPRALGNVMTRLLQDRVLADKMGEQARGRAREFSAEHMAERTVEVYERVIAARAASAKRASSTSVTRAP